MRVYLTSFYRLLTQRLGGQLVLVTTSVIVVLVVVLSTLMTKTFERGAFEAAQARATSIALMTAHSAAVGLDLGLYTATEEAVALARRNPDLALLLIYDTYGMPVARVGDPSSTDLMRVVQPVVASDDRRVGHLVVGLSLAPVHASIADVRRMALWTSMVAFAVVSLLMCVVSLLITRPLRHMHRVALRVAAGDLSVRNHLDLPLANEMRRLATSFDEMLDHVHAQNRRLADEVDERERTAHALRQSETRYSDLFDNAHDLIQSVRPDGSFEYVNQAWLTTFGYTRDDLATLHLSDVLHPRSAAQEQGLFGRITHDRIDATFQTRDGRSVQVEGSLQVSTDADGNVVATRTIMRDVTAQRAYEAELIRAREDAQQAVKAKSTFLATMSHELRTPMNGVLGMADLLLTTPLTDEQREFVETIHVSGDTLLAVINDVLDFSKIEAGKLELDVRTVEPRRIVESALAIVGTQARQRGLALRYALADDVPHVVLADEVRLRQVLVNLLSNAVKFTHEGGVDVRLHAPTPGVLEVSVHDTGIGIPPDRLDRLFKSFSQVDASTTRRFGGTGLGLVISKRLVEAMGGEIRVESLEHVGTTFTFTLAAPPAQAPAAPAPVPPPTRQAESMPPLRVLLVEDNLVNQRVARRMLERLGLAPDVAVNGVEAVARAQAQHYDVILMDVQMPEMDGHDATRLLRQTLPADAQPYIVALTANALADDVERSRTAGMDVHLSKPINFAALQAVLQAVPVLHAA